MSRRSLLAPLFLGMGASLIAVAVVTLDPSWRAFVPIRPTVDAFLGFVLIGLGISELSIHLKLGGYQMITWLAMMAGISFALSLLVTNSPSNGQWAPEQIPFIFTSMVILILLWEIVIGRVPDRMRYVARFCSFAISLFAVLLLAEHYLEIGQVASFLLMSFLMVEGLEVVMAFLFESGKRTTLGRGIVVLSIVLSIVAMIIGLSYANISIVY